MPDSPKRSKLSTDIRRASLIEAALAIAAQRNPAVITTGDLALAVGITQGAVFRHFSSKDAIWLAVTQWIANQLMQRLQTAAATHQEHAPLHALQDIFKEHVAFVSTYPGAPRVIFHELQQPQETPAKAAVRILMQRYRALVMELLSHASELQQLCPHVDANAAAVLFLGSIQGLVMQSLVIGQISTIATHAPAVFSIYLRGITPKEHP